MTTKISIDNFQQSAIETIGTSGSAVGPTISSIAVANSSYSILDDTAVDVNGGYIVITGTNFAANCEVIINDVLATNTIFVSANTIRAQVPAKAAGSYIVYVTNADGGVAIRVNGLTYSALPTWVTASTLTGADVDQFISINFSATEANAYTLQAGSSLPPGLTLSANGYLYGTVTGLSTTTTYNFTVVATDPQNQDSPRTFDITITAGDPYFNLVTTLLSGDTTTNTFISDASTNNFELTPNGDARANPFHPFNEGNYSNYFDGTGDYLTLAYNSAFNLGTGSFTWEAWIHPTNISGIDGIYATSGGSGSNPKFVVHLNAGTPSIHYNILTNGADIYTTATSAVRVNAWSHLAFVRNGTTWTWYINGVAAGTGSNSTDITFTNQTTFIGYGGEAYFTEFNGYISNVRLVKGTALYTSNFTPSTTPLTAITNTSLLTCQSNRFIDNSTNNFTITRNGDVAVDPFNPFIAIDSTTNGSGYFDGTGDSVTLPSSTPLSLTGDFTIEGWMWLDAGNLTYPLLFASGNFYVRFGDAGFGYKLQAAIVDTSVSTVYSCPIVQGDVIKRWSHIAFTRQSGVNKLFFNGVQQNLNTGANPSTYPLSSWTDSTTVGGSTWEIGTRINGYVSNFRVIKGTALYTTNFTPSTTPLTAVANTSLLTLQTDIPVNNHTFVDLVRNGIVTRNGNATQGTYSPYGDNWSNYFDGSGDYLTVPNNTAFDFGSGNFTIEAWIFTTSVPSEQTVFGKKASLANYQPISLGLINSAGTNRLYILGSTTGSSWTINGGFTAGSITIPLNTWTHIACVRNGTTITGYVNGVADVNFTGISGSVMTNSDAVSIGAVTTAGNLPFFGYISNLRILKGTALYTTNFTPATTPLQPIANTSLLTCRDGSFVDDGPNRFSLTRNGDVSVQKFSPFLTTTLPTPYFSNYFDGTGDTLDFPNSSAFAFGTGSFTIEFWINAPLNNDKFILEGRNAIGTMHITTGGFSSTAGVLRYVGSSTIVSSVVITDNTWHHCAIVRNGSSNITLYVDGVSVGTGTDTTNYTATSGTFNGIGGRSAAGSNYLTGYLSNFRILKGTALYTTNFTPSTTPLTSVANTSLLTCRSNTMIDTSNNNFAITATGNTIPSLFSPFTVSYTTKQAYTPEVFGGSAYFDGSGDFLSIPSNPAFDIGSSDFTIECWFNSNSFAAGQGLISRYNYTTVATGWALILNSSTVIRFIRGNDVLLDATVTAMNTRTWNHVAVVRSGSTIRTYLNGTQIAIATSVVNFTDATSALQVGRTNTVTNDMNGYISNVRVVKEALYTGNFVPSNTPSTVTANTSLLLNSTNAAIFDGSMKNDFETFGNARITTSIKKYGAGSIIMTGSGDYCRAVQNNLTNDINGSDFTIEFWVYFTSLAADRALVSKYGNAAENGGGLGYVLQWVQSTSSLRLVLGVGGGADNLYPWSWSPSTSTWYHVAVTRSGTSARAFINGTQIGTTTTVTTSDTVSPNPLQLGKTHTVSQFLLGYMDDFRLTRGFARYTSNFTPPTKLIDK